MVGLLLRERVRVGEAGPQRRGVVGAVSRGLIQRDATSMSLPSRAVHTEVPRDGVQPGLEPGTRLIGGGASDDPQPGLLKEVLGAGGVSRPAENEEVDGL